MIEAQGKIIVCCEGLFENAKSAAVSGEIINKITAINDNAREQQLVVPVVGAFSSGKSTMINSLIGENILPVDIKPETSLATELHYSSENYIEAVKPDGVIDRYQTGEINTVTAKAKDYQYARLYLNNKHLENIEPLVLVDMPGFSSPLEAHNKAIMAYLDRGCYYIVLSSVEEGTITKSLERRLSEIEGYGREFSFFLSKANLRPKESVEKLVSYYQDQLDRFDSKTSVVPLGFSADEVIQCLKSIDIENVFLKLYRGWLLDACDDIITNINLQISASKKDAEAISTAIKEMESGIEKLRKKATSDLEDMKRRYSVTMVNDLVSDVGRALEDSVDELTGIAISGNKDELVRHLNDIIRSALVVSIREKLDDIGRQIAIDFSESLKDLDRVMKDLELDENYLENITKKVESALVIIDGMIPGQTTIPKIPIPGGKDVLAMGMKTMAGVGLGSTVVAGTGIATAVTAGAGVAATLINPIIGIAVIFLPEIIRGFAKLFGGDSKDKQKEELRTKFAGEVFPSIKRKLREEIPAILNEHVSVMIQNISEQYEEQIKKQSEAINAQIAEKAGGVEENKEKQQKLVSVLSNVKNIDGEIRAWGK